MSMSPFQKLLRKDGIILLMAIDESIEPGSLIEKQGRGHFSVDHILAVSEISPADWKTRMVRGNLLQDNVLRSLSLHGRTSLRELGLAIRGGLTLAKRVNFDIQDIRVKCLQSPKKIAIQAKLERVRNGTPDVWNFIHDGWFADKTYYARRFTAVFEIQGNADVNAEVKQLDVLGGGSGVWSGKNTLEVQQFAEVPFAFSGWKISSGVFE